MSITATLRRSIETSGMTRYAISKATGVPESVLSRFASGERTLRGDNIDKLCEHLGLVLVSKNHLRRKES